MRGAGRKPQDSAFWLDFCLSRTPNPPRSPFLSHRPSNTRGYGQVGAEGPSGAQDGGSGPLTHSMSPSGFVGSVKPQKPGESLPGLISPWTPESEPPPLPPRSKIWAWAGRGPPGGRGPRRRALSRGKPGERRPRCPPPRLSPALKGSPSNTARQLYFPPQAMVMETDWEPRPGEAAGPEASGVGVRRDTRRWGPQETECWGLGIREA